MKLPKLLWKYSQNIGFAQKWQIDHLGVLQTPIMKLKELLYFCFNLFWFFFYFCPADTIMKLKELYFLFQLILIFGSLWGPCHWNIETTRIQLKKLSNNKLLELNVCDFKHKVWQFFVPLGATETFADNFFVVM